METSNLKNECLQCSYKPVCNGGCPYLNSINGFECPKNNFEINDSPLIRENFLKMGELE